MDQDATWYGGIGLRPGDSVLDGDPAPPPQKGGAPQFSAHVYCGQTAGLIKMALGMEVGLRPGHIVLDRDPAPPSDKRGTAPSFWLLSIVAKRLYASGYHLVRRYRPQPRRHCVRWEPSCFPFPIVAQPPFIGPCLLWSNGWMDEDGTWYGRRPRPRPHCVGWGLSSAPQKAQQPPSFRPMSIVATVAHLRLSASTDC